MYSAEEILLPLQRLQRAHDEVAHRDILSFDLHTRLKHMVLHFFKYAGKIEAVRSSRGAEELRRALLDAFIICMASANSLNVSLGAALPVETEVNSLDALARVFAKKYRTEDVFSAAVTHLVLIGGSMAKAMESADHMEDGNPRTAMCTLVAQMTEAVLGLLVQVRTGLEPDIRSRLESVERKSIFTRPAGASRR